jgi:hypothetical protein
VRFVRGGRADLESAPIPISRHTLREAFGSTLGLLLKDARNRRSAFAANRGCCGGFRGLLVAVRALAIGAAAAGKLPCAVVDPAVLAGAAPCAQRVVVGILIERDGVQGVQVAEDVAAPSTVMPPGKVGEVSGTNRVIANSRFSIGLWER